MKRSLGEQLLRAFWVLAGSFVTSVGIHLILASGAGADPLSMFEEGMAITLGIDIGVMVWVFNMAVLAAAFLINRKKIGIGTLITAVVIGPFLTFIASLGIPMPAAFWPALAVDTLGVVVVGLGIAVYMSADFGPGSLEVIMMFLSEKTHKSYGLVRVCMDCTWGVLGLLLGGTLGVGTVIGAFGVGISMEFFYRGIQKLILKQN